MEKSRGKKGKRAGWHLTLRLKDTIFAGIGVVGLMMMSFALGALAGRGDIYRVAYSWGLLSPDHTKVAQWPPPGVPVAPPGNTPAPAAAPAEPPGATAAKSAPAAAVTGSIAPVPTTSSSKKKAKTGPAHRDHKSREEEMRRVRQEVVQKLKFQNSFDTAPRPSRAHKSKDTGKVKTKTAAATKSVRVAQYRDSKTAKAKVAELQKKGVKATLKQTKDSKGTLYIVYKQTSSSAPGSEKVAQKRNQSTSRERKPQP